MYDHFSVPNQDNNRLKRIMRNGVDSPPENDCARTSAVKAVLGLTVVVFSSNRCSPSTFLQRPYRKLWRMSEVMMSDRAKVCCLNPAFRTKASAGNTEPMMTAKTLDDNNAKYPLAVKIWREVWSGRNVDTLFFAKCRENVAPLHGPGGLYMRQVWPTVISY